MKKRKIRAQGKAQTVSFDALIGVALFVVAVIFFFYMTGKESGGKQAESVEKESEKISEVLVSPQNTTGTLVSGSKVIVEKLEEISNLDYALLKAHLGVKSDFCIFFEDEKGNIVPVSENRVGIGNAQVNISGVACNETLMP